MDIIFINTEILFNLDRKVKLDTLININLLKYHTKCKFVLTDTTEYKFYTLEDKLSLNGIPIRPIDIIPKLKAEKGHRINIWLQTNRCDNFVILDSDIGDIENWYDNVVKVDNTEGFTEIKRKITQSFLGKL